MSNLLSSWCLIRIYLRWVNNTFYAVRAISYDSTNDNTVKMIDIGNNQTYVNKLKEDILYIAN